MKGLNFNDMILDDVLIHLAKSFKKKDNTKSKKKEKKKDESVEVLGENIVKQVKNDIKSKKEEKDKKEYIEVNYKPKKSGVNSKGELILGF